MSDNEVQVQVQPEDSPAAQDGSPPPEDLSSGPELSFGRWPPASEESLLLLAGVALAPPCGEYASCSCPQLPQLESSLHSIQLQLQFLLGKVDHLQDCLVSGQDHVEKEALAPEVRTLLYTSQPYFNHLESVRSNHVNADICSKLSDFSQQLCERLEQLVLTFASYHLLCLDETAPNSVSHFCIGQRRLGQLRLTIFRYCKPTAYLGRADTGLYKRMRWNVEQLGDREGEEEQDGDSDEKQTEAEHHTDYYFLCYEDIPRGHEDKDDQYTVERMWSIGLWVQVNPCPEEDDLCDWILCEVPRADYQRLLLLGHDEPSSCSATDFLQQLLSSHHEG